MGDGNIVACWWLLLTFDLWFFQICWDLQLSRCLGCHRRTSGSVFGKALSPTCYDVARCGFGWWNSKGWSYYDM